MKREINVFDYAETILKAVEKGALITTKAEGKVNTMTVSWGMLGIEWAKPVFITFVREHRFTREQLDRGMCFTVNIPVGEYDKRILGFCGTRSGRDVDKIKKTGLTVVDSDCIEAPAIKEFPLTLECRVVYRQLQDKTALSPEKQMFYPQDVDGSFHDRNRDYHVAYYGEIVKAYIIE